MNFIVNKSKAIRSGFMVIFMGGFGIYYLVCSMYPEAPVFLVLAAIFLVLFIQNASTITITDDRVSRSFLGFRRGTISWSEIRELGLIGENVFSHHKNKTGHKYIYFSPKEMTEKERFDMIVKWPPKKMLYVEYQERTLEYAMTRWGKELKSYNAEDLFPNSKD